MRGRFVAAALACAALVLAGAGVVGAAAFPVASDELTLVRVPGAVPEHSCTLTAVADSYVDEALPDTAFGPEEYVAVSSGPTDRRAFVRFDIASCGVPAGAEVRSARMSLLLTAAPAWARTWEVQRVTDVWHGPTVTWNTAPTVAAGVTDTAAVGTVAGVAVSWNVRADVADVVSGAATDRGWRIADADEESPVTVGGALASHEAAESERPSLTLTWFD